MQQKFTEELYSVIVDWRLGKRSQKEIKRSEESAQKLINNNTITTKGKGADVVDAETRRVQWWTARRLLTANDGEEVVQQQIKNHLHKGFRSSNKWRDCSWPASTAAALHISQNIMVLQYYDALGSDGAGVDGTKADEKIGTSQKEQRHSGCVCSKRKPEHGSDSQNLKFSLLYVYTHRSCWEIEVPFKYSLAVCREPGILACTVCVAADGEVLTGGPMLGDTERQCFW